MSWTSSQQFGRYSPHPRKPKCNELKGQSMLIMLLCFKFPEGLFAENIYLIIAWGFWCIGSVTFAFLFKLLVFSFKTFFCACKRCVFEDTDGILALFQMLIKTWKQTFKTWSFKVFAVFALHTKDKLAYILVHFFDFFPSGFLFSSYTLRN